MPIRPENRRHYQGKTWQQIRQQVLARAGNCCEGSAAYPDCRAANGQPHPTLAWAVNEAIGNGCTEAELRMVLRKAAE